MIEMRLILDIDYPKKKLSDPNRDAKGQQNTQKYNEFNDSSFKNQPYQSEGEDFDEE